MKTKIKICGIRSLESAEIALNAGADFLGFNFIPTSKRYISPEKAKEIIDQLRIGRYVVVVGVFQNQSVTEVNTIAESVGLDFVQLHGEETMEYMKQVKREIINTITEREIPRINDQLRNTQTKYFLLDRQTQGEGEMVSFESAKVIAKQCLLFFAGGVTPENVGTVISEIHPFAVDVASGVETHGVIDPEKLVLFMQNAKGVTL
ncbi:MAG TPA: phosphoribosylanthranilate isomerase [Candidatus Saccharimonadales bacterium]|nr:phosphoribosylanthranilate isomerase [Candidatus Saccharimonadales bacterium]